jgi:hypothetical protein
MKVIRTASRYTQTLCNTSLNVHHILSGQPYGGEILCVERDLRCVDFDLCPMLLKQSSKFH